MGVIADRENLEPPERVGVSTMASDLVLGEAAIQVEG